MAKKITQLTELAEAPATGDWFVVVDVSSGTTKKISWAYVVPDGGISTVKIAADAVTASKIDWASVGADGGIWWEELGRTTLGSASDTISVAGVGTRKHLMVLATLFATGGSINAGFGFNNDSGSNYAARTSSNGGADSTAASGTSVLIGLTGANNPIQVVMFIDNIATQEKLLQGSAVRGGTSGAGNVPARMEFVAKWANTSDQISRIDFTNGSSGDFAIGSEVIILGHN